MFTRFKEKAVGYSPWYSEQDKAGEKPGPLNFHSLVPIPDEVLRKGYREAGYDWERGEWGVKWGACHAELVDEGRERLFYIFDTAWVPPLGFIEKAANLWPTLTFVLKYEEGGMGFKGVVTAQADQITDHCVTC